MIPLAETYSKNGYSFTLISRVGDIAIYKQTDKDHPDFVAYEVFIVKKVKEANLFGRMVPAHEITPSNEEWGYLGYTCATILVANKKVEILQAKIDNRKNMVRHG